MASIIAGGSVGVPSSRISIPTPTISSSARFPVLTLQPGNRKDKQLLCALQESSTSTVATEKKDGAEGDSTVAVPAKKPKPAAAKAAVAKPLTQMMEEDVIPPLKAILEAQDDISEIDLSFQDNKLEGLIVKKGIQYSFWAFFPTGNLIGAKGFSISSYGSGPSTVEPFLVDERKPTANHVVFWVEKRLAAQGIIPVWNKNLE